MTPGDVDDFLARWVAAGNEGRWDDLEAMLAEDAVLHDPMSPEPARGRRAFVARARGQYEPFPDGRLEVVHPSLTRAGSDTFAYCWRFSGTHARRIDPPGFAATGRRVSVDGVSLLELAGSRVRATTLFFDATDMARQIGAAPPSGSALERLVVLAQRLRARRWR